MRTSWRLAALLIASGCAEPARPPPTATPLVVLPVASASADGGTLSPPGAAPVTANGVFTILDHPSCVLRGHSEIGTFALRYHGKRFGRVDRPVGWAEVQIAAGQPRGTIVGTFGRDVSDFTGEVELSDLEVALPPERRTMKDGWLRIDSLAVREVAANGELVGIGGRPAGVVPVDRIEMRGPCDGLVLGRNQLRDNQGTPRALPRGTTVPLRISPTGNVIGTFHVPSATVADKPSKLLPVRVLEQRGADVRLAIQDPLARAELWTQASALAPDTATTRATLLSETAEAMQIQMLAALGGGSGTPPAARTCLRGVTIYVRDGSGPPVAVGAFSATAVIPRAATPASTPNEVPIILGGETGELVPFVRADALAACGSTTSPPIEPELSAVPGKGLVEVAPAAAGRSASTPTLAPGKPVAGPKPDATLGAASSTAPLPDRDRILAGLRPRFRQCYQLGLNNDPSMTGKLTIEATIDAKGQVTSSRTKSASGVSGPVASCVANVVLRAQFTPAAGGQSVSLEVPITLTSSAP